MCPCVLAFSLCRHPFAVSDSSLWRLVATCSDFPLFLSLQRVAMEASAAGPAQSEVGVITQEVRSRQQELRTRREMT